MKPQNGSHPTAKTKAYAILAGGGVKGAALVGGLRAAEDHGFEFEGYAGASAGSVVALLGALAYKPEELERIIKDTDFSSFLDDETGNELNGVKRIGLTRYLFLLRLLGNSPRLIRIRRQLGLYRGHKLKEFLRQRITEQYKDLDNLKQISFKHLSDQGAKLLKVIVSDISQRKAIVYSSTGASGEINGFVVDAVRASIGYPFVFEPVQLVSESNEKSYLVDGGLSSNLPIFLFAREHNQTGYPVIAFDLIVAEKQERNKKYRFMDFCSDLIATALEAGDDLHRQTVSDYTKNVIYVPIKISPEIDTLKFSLTRQERVSLFESGYFQTMQTLRKELRNLPDAETEPETVHGTFNVPASLIHPLLKSMATEIEAKTEATNVRAHIMLPKGKDHLIITYQYGMTDEHPDKAFEVTKSSKWMQKVFYERKAILSDLNRLRKQPQEWGLAVDQVQRIKPDRQTLFSVPILEALAGASVISDLSAIGILSIDSQTPLQYSSSGIRLSSAETLNRWAPALDILKKWADIISRVLQ